MASGVKDCYSSANSEKDQQHDAGSSGGKNTEHQDEQQKYQTRDDVLTEKYGNATNAEHAVSNVGTSTNACEVEDATSKNDDGERKLNHDFNVAKTEAPGKEKDVVFIIKQDEENDIEEADVDFKVGATFDHYAKLVKAIQSYERRKHVRLYRRDSRTLLSIISRGRAPKKNFSMDLRYGELCYRCRHGGKKYKSFSTGARPNQRLDDISPMSISLYLKVVTNAC